MSGWAAIFNISRDALRLQANELTRLQEMVSSGARVNRPSDAPVDAFRILQLRADSQSSATYTQNLDSVNDSLSLANTILQSMSESLARARTLGAQAASGTYSEADREPVAREIDGILETILAFANRSSRGSYLFGGGRTDGAPYVATREGNTITGADYQGGQERLPVPVASGVEYGTVLIGDEIFRSDGREAPLFLGHTGAQPGVGTSNVRGDLWMTASHTSTTYLGASGVTAGDSSAAGDTILGAGHTLQVDAVAQTLSLDGGAVISYTGTETDLRLTGLSGDVAYVNTTGIAPGFQGTVNIQADGTLSIDDGASSVPIGLAPSDAVTDSRTGHVLYVDTTGIQRTGLEPVRVHGTYDVFGALTTLRDAILNTRNLPDADRARALEEALGALQEVTYRLTQSLTSTGAQMEVLTNLKDNITNMQDVTNRQADALENADMVDVATELARRQTLYEMTMASTARLLQLSLLNYL